MDNLTISLCILIIFVCMTGYYFKALTVSGAFAAALVGILIQLGFGLKGLLLLGLFFGSSSIWSKFQKDKKGIIQEKLERGERRDYIQVLANGSVAAIISILAILYPSMNWLYVFIVCLAAANSDTWASEIGSLSKNNPVYITTFKRVDPGTSGAISGLGTYAGIAGAFLIAIAGLVLWPQISFAKVMILAFLGFIGNFIDTLLGAIFQVKYRCQRCGIETEKKFHCNEKTVKERGCSLLNNDAVNFISILIAGSLAFFFF